MTIVDKGQQFSAQVSNMNRQGPTRFKSAQIDSIDSSLHLKSCLLSEMSVYHTFLPVNYFPPFYLDLISISTIILSQYNLK